MGAGADVYKPVTDILHQWLSIPEYLHKMFKSMHMQVIVMEINAFCKDFSYQLYFWDSEGIRKYVLLHTLYAEICSGKCR